MKKIIFVLSLAILILAGCAKSQESKKESNDAVAATKEGTAVIEKTDLGDGTEEIRNVQLRNGICYFTRKEKDDTERIVFYRQKEAESVEKLFEIEDKNTEKCYLLKSFVDQENQWYFILVKLVDGEKEFWLEKRTADGAIIYQKQADSFAQILEEKSVKDLAVDLEGKVVALTYEGVLLFWSKNGEESKSYKIKEIREEIQDGLGVMEDSIFYYSAGTQEIYFARIDIDRAETESEKKVLVEQKNAQKYEKLKFYSGYEDGCYIVSREGLWNYTEKEEKLECVLEWSQEDISIDQENIVQVGKDQEGFVVLALDEELKNCSRFDIGKQTGEEKEHRIEITLGCINSPLLLDNMNRIVKAYNRQSTEYYVRIVPYGKQEEGIISGTDELTLALVKGEGTDLIDMTMFSRESFLSKGILEDLKPYLDRDGVSLIAPIEKILETDGKIGVLGNGFYIQAVLIPKEYSAQGPGLSIDQCFEMAAENPQSNLIMQTDKTIALKLLMNTDMQNYVNYDTGSCDFTGEKFMKLLEAVNNLQSRKSREDLNEAEGLYQKAYLMKQVSIAGMLNYLELKEIFGSFAEITGYPNWDGEEKYPVRFSELYGINSKSNQKEGAWDFLKFIVSGEGKTSSQLYGFPVTEEKFEEKLDEAQEENDKLISYYTGETLTDLVPSQEDKAELERMLEHLYLNDDGDNEIAEIISQEATAVFEGDKTVSEGAALIQNRVNIYMNE